MPKGNTKAKRRDKYYYLAKDQGFRSRAAFKLVQLNKKHDFLSSSRALIDLCAAPGGWLQVAAKYMPVSSIIIGVDLVPIKPIHNVITLQEDITTPRCRAAIKKHLQQMNADVVICDGAPNMGKAWLQDAYTQVDLVLKALKLATDFLRPGGTFVTKVFRSADYNALLYVFHQFFKKVEATKPPASRNTSAEIYVVCTHYLAPDKIDPRLLDSKHVFKDLDMPLKKPDIFAPTKKKIRPNQSGYEEGNYTLFKSVSVAELIEAKDPISVLASFNQLAFDDTARTLGLDRHASAEIQACCQDLKVLNKKDFKNLLKWRLRVRAILHPEEAEAKAKAAAGGGDDDDDAMANVEVKPISREAIEEQLDKELEDKMTELDRKKKREKKKERARKAKLRQRVALGMDNPGDAGVQAQEEDLFSVTTVTSSADGDVTALLDQAPDEVLESPVDSEEENEWAGRDYDQYLDHQLDSMYDAYLERTKKRAPPAEKKKKKFKMGDEADDLPEDERFGGEEDDEEDEEEEDGERRVRFAMEEDGEAAPVSKKAKQAALWFSRGIFQDVGTIDDDDDDDSDDDVDETEFGGKRGRKRTAEDDEEEQDDEDEEEDDDEEEKKPKNKKQRQEATKDTKSKKNKKNKKKNKDDEDGEAGALDEFEVVPLARSDSEDEDSSEPEPESDLDEVATTLAIGKKYFLTKKRKREFEDDAYNRYAFDDGDDLPPWFVQDENRHNKPQKPVTKEEVEAEKARFRELNERPIKKVAEAKARKRLRMVKKVEKMKQKAAKIATAEGMSEREKIKSIRTLQKHTLGKAGDANAAPVYIVRTKHQTAQSRKGPSAGKNAKVKIVDPRLKKDKRGEQRAAKKRGGARGGRGGRGGKRR